MRLRESVERLLATVDHTPNDRLDVLLRLLQQRKRWLDQELSVERMLSNRTLPPLDAFALDYLFEPESSDESAYVRLLNRLDHAIYQVQSKMRALNKESITSDS